VPNKLKRLERSAMQSPMGLFELDATGQVLFANARFAALVGCTPGWSTSGPDLVSRLHPDDAEPARAALERSRTEKTPERLQVRFGPDDESHAAWILLDVVPFLSDDGEVSGWLAAAADITELKCAEAELKKAEARLAESQRIARLGNWEWDIERGNLWWSDEVYRVFGLAPREFGATYEAFVARIHHEDRDAVTRAVDQALEQNSPYEVEHRVVRPDGGLRIVQERGDVFRGADGTPARMVGTVHDVTEQRRLEQELRETQKMEAIGRLAGGIAHDFNNLLTVILNSADFLLDSMEDVDPRRRDVDVIKATAERASSLTQQLLAFSRRQVLHPKPVDLNAVVRDVWDMLRRIVRSNIAMHLDLTQGPCEILIDRSQLEQVLVNLAVNARDAMPNGGIMRITTRSVIVRDGGDPMWPRTRPGNYCEIEVADNGVGIPPELRSAIFEPFFTTKPAGEGTGLGLATVVGSVEQSGGQLRVDSAPAEGTRFWLRFPAISM